MKIEELIGEKWAAILPKAEELLAPVRQQLNEEMKAGITILPERNNIFRVFKEIGPDEITVLMIGQDPYHNPIGQATGRAFECGKHPSASWRKITEIYKAEVKDYSPLVVQGRLDEWSRQGVFLINKALTVRHKMPNSHTRFWEPFTRYAIGVALTELNPKAVVLLGSEAHKMVPKTPAPHKAFIYEHPAYASYQNRSWNAKGIFTEISKFLEFHGKTIKW